LQPHSSFAFRAIFHNEKFCDLQPLPLSAIGAQCRFRVNVIFTNPTHTLQALNAACALSKDLNAEVALLIPVTVPYPLPIDEPDVPLGFLCRRLTQITTPLSRRTDLAAYVYIGRDLVEMLSTALRPNSLVIVGTNRRWFFNKGRDLARTLRRSGHDVMLTLTN